METSITQEIETQAAAAAGQPQRAKSGRVARRGAHGTPKKAKSGKTASSAKKTSKGQKSPAVREDSKTAKVLNLLKRPDGATMKELLNLTKWKAHSLRGFLSTIGKKMGLAMSSTKGEDGQRTYRVKT